MNDIQKHCTFQPKVNKVPQTTMSTVEVPMPHSARSSSFSRKEAVENRLIAEAEKRRENREKIKRRHDDE